MPYEQNDAQKHVQAVKSAHAKHPGAAQKRDERGLARVVAKIRAVDWDAAAASLRGEGHVRAHGVLAPADCARLTALYANDGLFRSRVDMGRHRFGEGDYGYFAAPLPPIVETLRRELYARLAPIASRMTRDLGHAFAYPPDLADYTKLCHRAGQTRPTPLLLRYGAGGYNRLQRDLYGELAFPLQATILLSRPGVDFTGGEFLLLEDRPRQQARGEAIALEQGEMIVFPVRERPAPSGERSVRAVMRHGVSRIRSGERYALGIIFHDAA
jgi:hypothetical protein